jgi:hypothetical protein
LATRATRTVTPEPFVTPTPSAREFEIRWAEHLVDQHERGDAALAAIVDLIREHRDVLKDNKTTPEFEAGFIELADILIDLYAEALAMDVPPNVQPTHDAYLVALKHFRNAGEHMKLALVGDGTVDPVQVHYATDEIELAAEALEGAINEIEKYEP